MQGILELDIVSGSGVGHGTPDFETLSARRNYRRDSQSTVAGPPSCASVALRRRLELNLSHSVLWTDLVCPFGYERVYLPICKVADTPSHIQGVGMSAVMTDRVQL